MKDALIEIKEVKKVEGKKKLLICVVGFKMKNSYNPSSNYTDGLIKQLESLDDINKDFVYRMYYDDSITGDPDWEKVMKEMKKRPYTELYKYECKTVKSGKYHDGVFGTFVRFLPIFETKKERDWDVFTSMDIDTPINKEYFDILNKFQESKQEFFIKSPKCYHLKPYLNNLEFSKKYSLAINAMGFSSKITFNSKLLFNYLDDIVNDGENFKNFLRDNEFDSPSYLKNKENDRFVYGIDEYFLTDIVLKDLRKREIPILIYNWYIHYTGLLIQIKRLNNNFKELNDEEINRWKKLLKTVLRRGYDDKKSLNRNYSKLQYLTYCHENNFNMMICKNLAKEMRKIFENKKQHLYGIPDNMRKCFSLKNYNTYYVMKLKNKK
jgi:hypothetical protein